MPDISIPSGSSIFLVIASLMGCCIFASSLTSGNARWWSRAWRKWRKNWKAEMPKLGEGECTSAPAVLWFLLPYASNSFTKWFPVRVATRDGGLCWRLEAKNIPRVCSGGPGVPVHPGMLWPMPRECLVSSPALRSKRHTAVPWEGRQLSRAKGSLTFASEQVFHLKTYSFPPFFPLSYPFFVVVVVLIRNSASPGTWKS